MKQMNSNVTQKVSKFLILLFFLVAITEQKRTDGVEETIIYKAFR